MPDRKPPPPPPPPPRKSKSSSNTNNRNGNNPPPPPPQQRERSRRELDGRERGRSKREIDRSVGSQSRSKSRPKESSRHSSSRSRSRPRAKQGMNEKYRSSEHESKHTKYKDGKSHNRSNRSKSRPRQSSGSKPPENRAISKNPPDRKSPKPPQSRRPSSSNRQSKSSRNITHPSSARKPPSAKKREHHASNASRAIPSTVLMISGSHDAQTSADVSNINSQFQLPNPKGRAGGACTAALLQTLYQNREQGTDNVSWVDVLRQMRGVLEEKGFDQIPQLTSSRMIDVHNPFAITPTDGSFNPKKNSKRAVLIGINYRGQKGELSGCHNDVRNIEHYLMEVEGFKKENMTILMDDGAHKAPTKGAILAAYKNVVRESKEGDVVFCHYSGHGGRLADDNGDEEDGYDETLIPVDFEKKGQIRDDELLKILVHPLREGVTMTALMDCCHSGTVLDLPYRFTSDGDLEEMEMNDRCNFKDALYTGMGLAAGMAAGNAIAGAVTGAVASAVAPEPEQMMILGGGPNAIHEYSDSDCCVTM